jgi:hypothetical protein
MSYTSADDYENSWIITQPYSDSGANCSSSKSCSDGYSCYNDVCTPSDLSKPAPPIQYKIMKPVVAGNTTILMPIGVPVATGFFSYKAIGDSVQACNTDSDCQAGLWCLNNPDSASEIKSVCMTSGSGNVGDSCKSGAECLVGLDCYREKEGAKMSCQMADPNMPPPAPLADQLPKGSSCYFASQCLPPMNCVDYVCK